MKPLIYAKSVLNHDQIQAKLNIGCDGIEIQLVGELFKDKDKHIYYDVNDVFNLSEFDKYPIKCIHSPIYNGSEVLLERICDPEDQFLFEQIFKIVQHFGEVQDMQIPLIIHSETHYNALADIGNTWFNIRSTLEYLLDKYPNVNVLIENVTPVRGITKNGAVHLCNNHYLDNVEMAEILRKELNTTRVGTVLDTCHAMITAKYMGAIYTAALDVQYPDYSIEKYLEANKDYCGIIHLANFKGSGYGTGYHGTPFDKDSQYLLKRILTTYEDLEYTCPLTLEVFEYDYYKNDNYALEKHYVDMYFDKGI